MAIWFQNKVLFERHLVIFGGKTGGSYILLFWNKEHLKCICMAHQCASYYACLFIYRWIDVSLCMCICAYTPLTYSLTPSHSLSTFISKIRVELEVSLAWNFFEDCLMLIQNNLAFIQVLTFSEVFLTQEQSLGLGRLWF